MTRHLIAAGAAVLMLAVPAIALAADAPASSSTYSDTKPKVSHKTASAKTTKTTKTSKAKAKKAKSAKTAPTAG